MKNKSGLIFASFILMWLFFFLHNPILFFIFWIGLTIIFTLNSKTKIVFRKIVEYTKFITTELRITNRTNSIKISTMTNNMIINFTRPIMKKKIVNIIQNKLNYELEVDIRNAGRAINPKILAIQGMAYMFVSILIITPIAISLAIIVNSIFFLILIIPIILVFYPKIKLKLEKIERKIAIDDEIAFFTTYASVMQSIGKSFYTSILEIDGKKIFPIIETESKMLDRNIRLFGMDPITALNNHGMTHPNTHFSNLLLGYVSISKSGGDLGQFMEKKSDEFFTYTRFKFSKYTKQSEIISELMLILLNILPTLLMTSSFLMAEESIRIIMSISFIVIPVITALMIIIINNLQPKINDNIKFNIFSILFGGIFLLITLIMNQPPWMILAVSISATAIFNQIIILHQFREITMIESALPDFFRDITEYRKIGIAVPNAFVRIANNRSYNRYFDSLLFKIAINISFGNNLSKILESMRIRSWLSRTSFFILGKIAESGGGTPENLEQITSFLDKIKEAKNEMKNGLQVFSYMAYASPLLMILSASGMKDIMIKIIPEMQQLMQNGIQVITITPDFLEIVNLLIIISSLCMGLIMSKITYFTIKHTMTVGISSTIAMILVFIAPQIPPFIK